jgi:uncharacterized protein YqjF (DUF2071 family)
MSTFLNAEWRKLVMANYTLDPNLLQPFLPAGTSLDLWKGQCYVSLIGFLFLNTRVKGCRIPYHIDFEEVNLRFYVVHDDGISLKRGVVFIKEIVPKRLLTFVANTIYGEHYATMPMRHEWKTLESHMEISYQWKQEKWHTLAVQADLSPHAIAEGSEEEFITEHYWGYTRLSENKTSEYGVEHPRWEVYPVNHYQIDVDFAALYDEPFSVLNQQQPVSVFLAEGSEIKVLGGTIINRSL